MKKWISRLPCPVAGGKSMFFLMIFFFVFSFPCFAADVVINEVFPNPATGDEWVEFYNPDNTNISDWILEEKTGSGDFTQYRIGDYLTDNAIFDVFTFKSSKLNNDGDVVKIKNGDQLIDEYSFGNTLKDTVYGRYPDGGSWFTLSSPTKGSANSSPLPSSSPSPSNIALLNIHEVKDSEGNVLNEVEIYLDEFQLSQPPPQTLTFCDNCLCDGEADCSFGSHRIRVVKNGYQDWIELAEIFGPGQTIEVNPVMSKGSSDSGTSTSSPSPSASPSPKSSPKPSASPKPSTTPSPLPHKENEASFSGEVLGQQSSPSPSPQTEEKKKKFKPSLPLIISLSGAILLLISAIPFLKPKIIHIIGKLKNRQLNS